VQAQDRASAVHSSVSKREEQAAGQSDEVEERASTSNKSKEKVFSSGRYANVANREMR